MNLTPEQQDLKAAIERCIANPSADNHATVKTMTQPRAILALLAQLEAQAAPSEKPRLSMSHFATMADYRAAQRDAAELAVCERLKGLGLVPSAPTQTGAAESALRELADQAQELGMGYEGMVMPSPPGSAGSGDHVMIDAFEKSGLCNVAPGARWYDDATQDSWVKFQIGYKAGAALSQPVQAVPDAVRSAGFKMSNVMFNLSQANDSPDAKQFGELYKEWDAAIRSVRVLPAEPPQ